MRSTPSAPLIMPSIASTPCVRTWERMSTVSRTRSITSMSAIPTSRPLNHRFATWISLRKRRNSPGPDPAAVRHRHVGPGQPGTSERFDSVEIIKQTIWIGSSRRSAIRRSGLKQHSSISNKIMSLQWQACAFPFTISILFVNRNSH